MKLVDIYGRMKKDIQYIEKQLEHCIHTNHDMLKQTSIHLLKAGGKRLRPVFVLMAGQFGNYRLDQLTHVAVPLELIHMATLVHDDVIDDATTRRGKLTVKTKWDNKIAMYTGDYIIARALEVVTELSNPRIHQVMSKAIVEMCIGEMEQIRYFFHSGQTIRHYLLRIRRKTALLIAVSCQLGAMAAEATEQVARKLYDFGYNVGMAFQIRDDILDLCGTEKQLGKPPGSDIRQGNITLPVIYALEQQDLRPTLLQELEQIRQQEGEADASLLIRLVRGSGAIERADELAGRYIDKAVAALDGLPEIQAKDDLVKIAHFVGSRSY